MTPEKTRDKQGHWLPGSSGNPAGRPAGSGHVARLRAELAQELPTIIKSLIEQAKAGDIQAIRIILDRVVPPLKAVDAPLSIPLPEGGLSDQGRAIIASAASGEVSPADASQLLGAISQLARIEEFDELVERVNRLEQVT
jgi:hypothetical protein